MSTDMSQPSSLPPLPPGLPSRPTFDSYRPSPPPSLPQRQGYEKSDSYQRNDDMYQFRGDGYSGRGEKFPLSSYPPRSPPHRYGGDSYRPPGAGSFSFRMEPPPSIDPSRMGDSYRPPPQRVEQFDRRSDDFNRNSTGQNGEHYQPMRSRQGPRRAQGRFPSRKAAERPFLRTNRSPTPDLMPGMGEEEGAGVKFRAIEDMSDSEEAEMDLSSDDDQEQFDGQQPKKKQARTELNNSKDGEAVPKWSNPDPYTALPPTDELQRKKLDVVKLIRKARVAGASDTITKADAVTDDFISFGFDDEVKDHDFPERLDDDAGQGMPGAPTGPRAQSSYQGSFREIISSQPVDGKAPSSTAQMELESSSDPALGNRKRTIDDEIKGDIPSSKRSKQRQTKVAIGDMLPKWRVDPELSPNPWCTVDHAATANMGYWLHKEIMDFYYHVKPVKFEDLVRSDLIDRLSRAVRGRWKDADIHAFGSFVSGIYLPTADMDLVLVSKRFLDGGFGIYDNKKSLYNFRNFLEKEGIPVPNSVEVIAKAKVPLVKYVDKRTGLRVDISFENDSGLIANGTFKDWKATYPAMPILVTLIKQFLAMRGLNEPMNGGIGGFSVTCLVTSLLQLAPQIQSGNMIPEHHLGEVLMEFFDLYGNQFNPGTTAIQLNPPGYTSKNQLIGLYKGVAQEKFCIIDPNNHLNDISGGAKNTSGIRLAFSQAYQDLQKRMYELHETPIDQRGFQSILSVILGGNYSSFDIQRERLWEYYETLTPP